MEVIVLNKNMIIGIVIGILIFSAVIYAGYNSPRMSPELGLDIPKVGSIGSTFIDTPDIVEEDIWVHDNEGVCSSNDKWTLVCPQFTVTCWGGEWTYNAERQVWINDGNCNVETR